MDEDCENDPFSLFDYECNDVNIEVRIKAIKKLPTIAATLDVERTKNELIPYLDVLTKGDYNDDELLLNVAEQLGDFVPYIGGIQNANLIINLLENLAAIDEQLVRDKAIESLIKVAKLLDKEDLEQLFVPLISRLANSEWFTPKVAATALFPMCYEQVDIDIKDDLRRTYRVLCQDDCQLVRRAAASKFPNFATVLEIDWIVNEFIPVFNNLAKDHQDSVRAEAVDVGISIAYRLNSKEIESFVILAIIELSNDLSWKVRYKTAIQVNLLQIALGRELTEKYLLAIFQNLIHDTEPQVREATAKNIAGFCQILQDTYTSTERGLKEVADPIIINQMLPLIQELDGDCNSDVKEALANVLTSMSPLLGEENTRNHLLPIITASLINDSFKVNENIIANLNSVISLIGVTDIVDIVLNIATELLNTSNSVWRSRRNLIITISYVAVHAGKEYFDGHLKVLYEKLLNDGVYAVRQTAPLIIPILIKNFGMQWALNSMIPIILNFADHKHYLYRYVCIFCIDELISPTLSDKSASESNLTYVDHANRMMTGEISDDSKQKIKTFLIRLNVLNKTLSKKLQKEWIQTSLKKLEENYFTADDIYRYAEGAIEVFTKDNKFDILNVSEREICIEADEIYVEGILYLSIYQFLPVLQKLSKDPVFNVQLKVANSISKIKQFSQVLQAELDKTCMGVLESDDCQEGLNAQKYQTMNSSIYGSLNEHKLIDSNENRSPLETTLNEKM